ncbi:DgyrCDS9373 [Dimorphilus gyrociliatus]|uniref:DgyrCDS9373 n=1 Tax=Dimorphilus gyrociliatus TaxID=2664684 RepID=A0A7I8VYZ9_9ANNE|nr:DgyrCDS9373 [Dimorphilus gyrociliatus]
MPAPPSVLDRINTISRGLKRLEPCKLMKIKEFKELHAEINQHFREIELAHLTGTPKDSIDQLHHDSNFYYMLIRMMLETLGLEHKLQISNFRKIYGWYLGNRHVLYAKPRFGRDKVTTENDSKSKTSFLFKTSPEALLEDLRLSRPQSASTIATNSENSSFIKQESRPSTAEYKRSSINSERIDDRQEVELVKRPILPLSHLVNPLARQISEMDAMRNETHKQISKTKASDASGRPLSASERKSAQMNKLERVVKDMDINMQILDELQKPNTDGFIRNEEYTSDVINYFASVQPTKNDIQPAGRELVSKPLTEFLIQTENYFPQRKNDRNRLLSANKSVNKSEIEKKDNSSNCIKLKTVVNLVDSVGEDMAGENSHMPLLEKIPIKDETKSESSNSCSRPMSSSDPIPPHCTPEPDRESNIDSFNRTGAISGNDGDIYVDWRGIITPDTSSGKFTIKSGSQRGFENHTYVRKLDEERKSLRSQGSTTGSIRPRVPPTTPRERWTRDDDITERRKALNFELESLPSRKNKRMSQAASHTTTIIEDNISKTLLTSQRLGKKSKKRRKRIKYSDFGYHEMKKIDNQPPQHTEFVSFCAPKSMLVGDRLPSARTINTQEERGHDSVMNVPNSTDHFVVTNDQQWHDNYETAEWKEEEANEIMEETEKLKEEITLELGSEHVKFDHNPLPNPSPKIESKSPYPDLNNYQVTRGGCLKKPGKMRQPMNPSDKLPLPRQERLEIVGSGNKKSNLNKKVRMGSTLRRSTPKQYSSPKPDQRKIVQPGEIPPGIHVMRFMPRPTTSDVVYRTPKSKGQLYRSHSGSYLKIHNSSENWSTQQDVYNSIKVPTAKFDMDEKQLIARAESLQLTERQHSVNRMNSASSRGERPLSSSTIKSKSSIVSSKKCSGRPIAHYLIVNNVNEERLANEQTRRHKAAVDIQRIFRGYVTRSRYLYLRREFRMKREDARLAQVNSEKEYYAHKQRLKGINNRNSDHDQSDWEGEYQQWLEEKKKLRQFKVENTKKALLNENQSKKDKLSRIGPHVEVYDAFNPPKHLDVKEYNKRATKIQSTVRGFLLRRNMEKLRRKCQSHASDWSKFTSQYKALVRRIQVRHGIERPKTPFNLSEVDRFMDAKRKYEQTFDKLQFNGEIELGSLMDFLKECHLYPSLPEVREALDFIYRGKNLTPTTLFKKHEIVEILFELYPPPSTGFAGKRRSTWMNPIIDGVEAWAVIGKLLVFKTYDIFAQKNHKTFSRVSGSFLYRIPIRYEHIYKYFPKSILSVMSTFVEIVCPNGRWQRVKVTAKSSMLQVLEEVCLKQKFVPPSQYILKHGKKKLDLTLSFRYSGLPNRSKLELVESDGERKEEPVMVAIQFQDGSRTIQEHGPEKTLWDILEESLAKTTDDVRRVFAQTQDSDHVCLYITERIAGKETLKKTQLRNLGLFGGRAIIRYLTAENSQVLVDTSRQSSESEITSDPVQKKPKMDEDATTVAREPTVAKLDNKESSVVDELLDRETKLYNSAEAPDFKPLEESDEFFEVTVNDVRKMMEALRASVENAYNQPLLTQKFRQEVMNSRFSIYERAIIRFVFSNRLILQACFKPSESLDSVYNFITKCIAGKFEIQLYTTPPKKILKNANITLIESKLVPLAKVYVKVIGQEEVNLSTEVLERLTTEEEALKVINKWTGTKN